MTFVQLKNAGAFAGEKVDPAKGTSTLIASQKIGDDRYRQVFRVAFVLQSGKQVDAIAVSDASSQECSLGEVTVYRVLPVAQ